MLCSQMTRPKRKSVLESWGLLSLPFQASPTCAPKTALNMKPSGPLRGRVQSHANKDGTWETGKGWALGGVSCLFPPPPTLET